MDPRAEEPFEVLVFSKTAGYRHASIPAGIAALRRLAAASTSPAVSPGPFTVTATEDAAAFFSAPSLLSPYRILVLLQASGDFFDAAQLAALQSFVRDGGSAGGRRRGVVGIHCASTGMPSRELDPDGWYARLVGAAFLNHPAPQAGTVLAEDPAHVILARGDGMKAMRRRADRADMDADGCREGGGGGGGGEGEGRRGEGGGRGGEGEGRGGERKGRAEAAQPAWEWFDEWYNFQTSPRDLQGMRVLLTVDEGTYQGGKHGADHPVAWCRDFEGARSFYTALGHFDDAYEDDTFIAQILNGILWAAGVID